MKEVFDFLAEFGRNRREVGSMIPSSRFLGDELSRSLKSHQGPKSVLEVGPGTGAVTSRILRWLKPGDRLVLVEASPRFCEILKKRLDTVWASRVEGVQIEVRRVYIEQVEGLHEFDFIISGLPLNNFDEGTVRSILASFQRLLKPTGKLSWFEYMAARRFRHSYARIARKQDVLAVNSLLSGFIQDNQVDRSHVLLNFPPAVARHFSLAVHAADEGEEPYHEPAGA